MAEGGMFTVTKEDIQRTTSIDSNFDIDFVHLFPPELCNKLFQFLSDKDLFNCAKCSIGWHEVINSNSLWKTRCIRRGWATPTSTSEQCDKWTLKKSHVPTTECYEFRPSPVFCLPEIASLRVSPLCDWAVYFRQCLHIQRNWTKGVYYIQKLLSYKEGDENSNQLVNNDFACDGQLAVVGTASGKLFIWSVTGVPEFLTDIPNRRRDEVEIALLKGKYLIVLYHSGNVKVFDTSKLTNPSKPGHYHVPLLYQIKGVGSPSIGGFEWHLVVEYIHDQDEEELVAGLSEDDPDIITWIRNLFRIEFWMGSEEEDMGSDLLMLANDAIVVLTGVLCRCFFYWNIENGDSIRQVYLIPGFQVIYQGYISTTKLYFSTKKREDDENNSSYFILVYNVSDLGSQGESGEPDPDPLIIPSGMMVEEIHPDSTDKRIVYSTQDGTICALRFDENVPGGYDILFSMRATSFVDNLTVDDSLIIYHQYDGYLVAMDWNGIIKFEIEAHIGLVKGMKICDNEILVTGGEAMQLCVWNVKNGEKLHNVHHQPSRILHLYADSTKIVTVGREDCPVLVAYW